MMKDELNDLSQMKAPQPAPQARARALSAAMAAFDEAENISRGSQGKDAVRRPSSILNRLWSPVMNRKFLAGSALATLIVVPAAAFLTLELTRGGLPVDGAGRQIEIAAREPSEKQAAKTETAKPKSESPSGSPSVLQQSAHDRSRPAIAEQAGDGGGPAPDRDGGEQDDPEHPEPRPQQRGVVGQDEAEAEADQEELDRRPAHRHQNRALEAQALPAGDPDGHADEDE